MSRVTCGSRYTRLVVVEPSSRHRYFWTKCDCGTRKEVREDHLLSGKTQSCGCLRSEIVKTVGVTHGMYYTSERKTYSEMLARCLHPENHRYADYGGRGITVSDSWRKGFEEFFADMGLKPAPEYTLERIDNDRGYCKENCKWATRTEQNRNRRNTIMIPYEGTMQPLAAVAETLNIPYFALRLRYVRGDTGQHLLRPLKQKAGNK